MNKKSILSALLALAAMTGQAQNTYTVSCDVSLLNEEYAKENVKVDSFYLADFVSQEPITEKCALQGNKIAISGRVEKPQIAALLLESQIQNGVRTNRFPLILEAGDIVITQDDWMSCRVGGTPLNDALFDATREIGKASEAGDKDKAVQLTKDYILAHRNDLTAALMLTALPHSTVPEARKVLALISQCGEVVQDRNFTALGVAVKDKPEATLRAIKDDAIPYPQILNSQAVASELYGIDAIPELILFAPDGTILVRGNNRMDAIEQKLAEVFPEEDWRPHGQIQSAHPY